MATLFVDLWCEGREACVCPASIVIPDDYSVGQLWREEGDFRTREGESSDTGRRVPVLPFLASETRHAASLHHVFMYDF